MNSSRAKCYAETKRIRSCNTHQTENADGDGRVVGQNALDNLLNTLAGQTVFRAEGFQVE